MAGLRVREGVNETFDSTCCLSGNQAGAVERLERPSLNEHDMLDLEDLASCVSTSTAARRSSRSAAPRRSESISSPPPTARSSRIVARPAQATGAGIVILPDVRGLHPSSRSWRCASRSEASRRSRSTTSAGPPARRARRRLRLHAARRAGHAGRTSPAISRPRSAHLRGLQPRRDSIFATGFCMGGRLASMPATLGLGLPARSRSTAGRPARTGAARRPPRTSPTRSNATS